MPVMFCRTRHGQCHLGVLADTPSSTPLPWKPLSPWNNRSPHGITAYKPKARSGTAKSPGGKQRGRKNAPQSLRLLKMRSEFCIKACDVTAVSPRPGTQPGVPPAAPPGTDSKSIQPRDVLCSAITWLLLFFGALLLKCG